MMFCQISSKFWSCIWSRRDVSSSSNLESKTGQSKPTYTSRVLYRQYLYQSSTLQVGPTLVEYFTGSTYTSRLLYRQYLHKSSTLQVVTTLVEYFTGSTYTSRVLYRQYLHQSSTIYTSRVLFTLVYYFRYDTKYVFWNVPF